MVFTPYSVSHSVNRGIIRFRSIGEIEGTRGNFLHFLPLVKREMKDKLRQILSVERTAPSYLSSLTQRRLMNTRAGAGWLIHKEFIYRPS